MSTVSRTKATRIGRAVAGVIAIAAMVHTASARETASPTTAVATRDFLDSIGVVTSFPDRGQPLQRTIEMLQYCGFGWVRGGIEGLSDDGPTTIQTVLALNRATGVRLSWGLGSGGADIAKLVKTAKVLARAGALLAIEGNNEPNNWGITYQGEKGGGRAPSWMAVAKLQRDLYRAVKSDPELAAFPVWSISEPGAQRDNVGLQYLTIPPGSGTLMPDGTTYADAANVHNYLYHPNARDLADNKAWDASDPSAASKVDGLYGNFGTTWAKHFTGYSQHQLDTLPRVTTETGVRIEGDVTEEVHASNLVNLYLAQFSRGFSHTAVYILRDRIDESGNQKFGFFRPDYTPRRAALHLRNLTTILADSGRRDKPGRIEFSIENQPATVHTLLLQNSNGTFQLVVWGERLAGEDKVTVRFAGKQPLATVYDPTIGVKPVEKLANIDTLQLTLSDHPLIVSIPAPDREVRN